MTPATLRRLAGSVTLMGFRGISADSSSTLVRDLGEAHVAGVILFDEDHTRGTPRNVVDREQVRRLIRELRDACSTPLLVAVDQEGGAVRRLKPCHGFPDLPSAGHLGRGNAAETRRVAEDTARALADVGVHINFAPVVDLDRNPAGTVISGRARSFGSESRTVIEHARAFIDGHHAHGVATTLKHFPGHGSASGDSHSTAVDITDTFDEAELEPYGLLISEGFRDLVMVGHLLKRDWDPDHPASLSRRAISGVLRGELGFDGVVVSDDLDMAAVADHYSLEQRVALALHAGVDLLVFGNNLAYDPDRALQVCTAVESAVRGGALSESCLRDRAARTQALAQRLNAS